MKIIFLIFLLSTGAHAVEMKSQDGRFFVDCSVESHKDLCHVDTGAFTARVRAVNGIQNYKSLGKTKSKGAGGEVLESDLVKIRMMAAGDLKQSAITAATLPEQFPYSVMGLEFFKSFKKLTFDFDKLKIQKGLLQKKHLCSTKMNLNNQLIQLEVKVAGTMRFAAFDTGASLSVVSKALVEVNLGAFVFVRDIANGQDSNGKKMPVKMYRLKSLGLCGMDYQDVAFVAVDLSGQKKEMAEFPDIFLGANLMVGNSWSFDFTKQQWYLQ